MLGPVAEPASLAAHDPGTHAARELVRAANRNGLLSITPMAQARRASGDGPRPEPVAAPAEGGGAADHVATAPQLRRFIKSRAYVPMHELRRRFAINGDDDEVTPLEVDRQRVYVGLPEREGLLLGELLRGGDIGAELSLDPIAPIVVGVYPMRPIPRS